MSAGHDAPRYGGWDDGTSHDRLREAFPELETSSHTFRGELTLAVPADRVTDVLAFLRDDEQCRFDFLTDVTAVHWPDRELPFEIVYHLYSFPRNVRLRVKCSVGPEPEIPSVVPLWPTADWLERECYDMFGVVFRGHPDLRRILMTEDYEGWPLRKEFPLKV
jgi:NADH-quinone oxidoreductase subunit C